MVSQKKNCPSCGKQFSANTLNKYGGICGRCNTEKEKAELPSLFKRLNYYLLSAVFSASLVTLFVWLNPTLVKDDETLFLGDREFAHNEFLSQEELSLFLEVKSIPTIEREENWKGYKSLISLNPYKQFYKDKLVKYGKPVVSMKEVIPKEEIEKINKFLDSILLDNFEAVAIKSKLMSKYPLLGSYQEDINILPKKTVYLFYENLPSGGLWDKPGAKNFGGKRVGTVSFTKGPVKAECVAHKSLEGGRNYFYVVLQNGDQGWMGRPYVMRDRRGREFLMPNPLTGEEVRVEFKVEKDFLSSDVRLNTERYIPSYDSIDWDNRIPVRFRREGYSMYSQAMLDGYAEVDRLVSQYQGF